MLNSTKVPEKMLARLFKRYYREIPASALQVKGIEKREFAYVPFDKHAMIRHIGLNTPDELKSILQQEVPLHVYYSSAYYEAPGAQDMNEKLWLGADLVFDIDADHIPTLCKEEHDSWRCLDCGAEGMGMAPEKCFNCSSKKLESESWVCDSCLEVAKSETIKLIDDFLTSDLGFSIKELAVVFSGHRGFHVHVEDQAVLSLDVDARREIADYVRGWGISVIYHGFLKRGNLLVGPSFSDFGWRGRLARGFYDYLSKADEKELLKLKLPHKWVTYFALSKERILSGILQNPPYWSWLKVSTSSLDKMLPSVLENVACKIDERVTIDIKRLMRVPNTLHGKTGLVASKLPYGKLDSFEPLKDAAYFKEEGVKLKVRHMPKMKLGGNTVGPLKDAIVDLPMELATYLLAKGAAEFIKEA